MGFFGRLVLAFACFFRIIAGSKLPASVKQLGVHGWEAEPPPPPPAPAPPPAPPPPPKVDEGALIERGGLLVLGLLQREGRLMDFLQEDIDGFADAQIGAAARDVWRGCRKAVREHMKLVPVLDGEEDGPATVDTGYDPHAVRLSGNVGEPPFKGTLRHHGWRATEVKLPQWSDKLDAHVVAPAEVEV